MTNSTAADCQPAGELAAYIVDEYAPLSNDWVTSVVVALSAVTGIKAESDKAVLERIADPLMHLVRYAMVGRSGHSGAGGRCVNAVVVRHDKRAAGLARRSWKTTTRSE